MAFWASDRLIDIIWVNWLAELQADLQAQKRRQEDDDGETHPVCKYQVSSYFINFSLSGIFILYPCLKPSPKVLTQGVTIKGEAAELAEDGPSTASSRQWRQQLTVLCCTWNKDSAVHFACKNTDLL